MHTGSHAAPIVFFFASGFSAYLLSGCFSASQCTTVRILSGLVLWEVIQLVPAQLVASLQLAGIVEKVTVPELAWLETGVLAVSAVWSAVHRPLSSRVQADKPATRKSLPTYILVSAAALACSWILFAIDLFTSFPNGSDAVAYHLPLALRWLQDGSLAIPASRVWQFSLPGNAEIGMMVLLSTGSESAAVLVNFIAAAVLAIATYLLAMWFTKADRLSSITITLITLSIPIVEFQTFSAYVDLYGTAFIMAAFALFLSAQRWTSDSLSDSEREKTFSMPMLVISSFACGVSLGTKPIYFFYGAVYWLLIVLSLLRERRALPRLTHFATVSMVIGTLLPSALWFGRALQETRNPVYPIQVRAGHRVILAGYAPSQITTVDFDKNFVRKEREWLIYAWTEWKRSPGYLMIPYGEGSGVGAAFATFVPLGVAFLCYRSFVPRSGNSTQWILLALLAALLLVWWFLMQRVPRFGLPILILACVLATPVLAALQTYRPRAFGVLLVCSVLITCAISSFVPFHDLAGRLRTRRWTRPEFYRYPKIIDQLPAGSHVLNYTRSAENNFPLVGSRLTNWVVPDFEVPSHLTPEFIRERRIDFIVETVPHDSDVRTPEMIVGASVMKSEVLQSGETGVLWRIWRVDRQRSVVCPGADRRESERRDYDADDQHH